MSDAATYKLAIHMTFAFEVHVSGENEASLRAQIEAAFIANLVRNGYSKGSLAEMRRDGIEIEQVKDKIMSTQKMGFSLCPTGGLKKGDTILLESELISDMRRVEVLKTQYLSDNVQVRVFYRNEDGVLGNFTKNEFDTVFREHPEIPMSSLEDVEY